MNRCDLAGEAAIVTGGAASVGRCIAETLLARGARVHICDVDANALAMVLTENPGLSGTLGTVSDPSQVERIVNDARARIGEPSILINNVGIGGPRCGIEDVSTEDWQETLGTNVSGMFYCIRALVPAMKRARHGIIVNVSSGSTRTGLPLRTPYVVSKYAVEGLTRNLCRELGPHGIRVNAVLPGIIDNARMRGIMERKAVAAGKTLAGIAEEYLRYVSMGTMIKPIEIAEMVAFIVSPFAGHVTGQLIGVDGNLEWEE